MTACAHIVVARDGHPSSPRGLHSLGNYMPPAIAKHIANACAGRDDAARECAPQKLTVTGATIFQFQMRRAHAFPACGPRAGGALLVAGPHLSVRVACVPPGRRERCPTYHRSRLLVQTARRRLIQSNPKYTARQTVTPIASGKIQSMMRFPCVVLSACPCLNQTIVAKGNPQNLRNICFLTPASANSAAPSSLYGPTIPARCWPTSSASASRTQTKSSSATARSQRAPCTSSTRNGLSEVRTASTDARNRSESSAGAVTGRRDGQTSPLGGQRGGRGHSLARSPTPSDRRAA